MPFATRPAQPRYCRCTPAVAGALLLLACFIQRPDHQAAPSAGPARCLIQPRHREPAHDPIAAQVSQDARLSSRCVRSGDRSPACSAIVQPLRFGSPLASAPAYFARLQPRLRPGETGPQQGQQLPALPRAQARP